MKTPTIVIVGGSFAGLAAAIHLQKYGIQSTIIEHNVTPSAHTTGGISNSWFREDMELPPKECISADVRAFKIVSPHMLSAEFQASKSLGGVLNIERYLEHYIEKFKRTGGELLAPANFYSLSDSSIYLNIDGRLERRKANFVIAADGANSAVRSFLNLEPPKAEDMHLGYEETFPNTSGEPGDEIQIYIDQEIAPKGYWWIFPDSNGKNIRVGLGVPKSENLNPRESFQHRLIKKYPKWEKRERLKVVAGQIPTAPLPQTNVYTYEKTKILFVGDAGNFCSNLHGGGIGFGILSGILAAESIVTGKSYDKLWMKELAPILGRHTLLKKVLYGWKPEDFDRAVEALSSFEIDIDKDGSNPQKVMAKFLWHLFRNYPGLVPKFARAAL